MNHLPFHVARFSRQPAPQDNAESAAIGLAKALRGRLLGGELLLSVIVKLAQQLAFEVRVVRLAARDVDCPKR